MSGDVTKTVVVNKAVLDALQRFWLDAHRALGFLRAAREADRTKADFNDTLETLELKLTEASERAEAGRQGFPAKTQGREGEGL